MPLTLMVTDILQCYLTGIRNKTLNREDGESMKNTKHTAGPWVAVYRPNMNIAGIHIRASDTYLEVSYCNSSETETPESNARLIASAPEMLEALEHLSNELCEGEFVKHSADAIRKIKSAIAKARGEE